MTKSKNKRKNTSVAVRQARGRPTENQKGAVSFANSNDDLNHTIAISDPFSPQARGSKIPDEDSTKSFTVQIRDVAVIGSDSNGNGGICIRPHPSNTYVDAATLDGNNVTAWGSASSITDYTALADAADKFRIVSWGVRIYSQLAPTDQSGQFRVITTPETTTNGTLAYQSSFFEEIKVYPMSEDSVHWISRPIGVTWKEYVAMNGTAPWEHVTIIASGMPATTANCVTCEVVFNFEMQPNLASVTGALSTDASEHKPHVMYAAGEVLKKHGGAMVRRGASNFFENAARFALNFASRRLFGVPLITQPKRMMLTN